MSNIEILSLSGLAITALGSALSIVLSLKESSHKNLSGDSLGAGTFESRKEESIKIISYIAPPRESFDSVVRQEGGKHILVVSSLPIEASPDEDNGKSRQIIINPPSRKRSISEQGLQPVP